jgi:hypothetical protein
MRFSIMTAAGISGCNARKVTVIVVAVNGFPAFCGAQRDALWLHLSSNYISCTKISLHSVSGSWASREASQSMAEALTILK